MVARCCKHAGLAPWPGKGKGDCCAGQLSRAMTTGARYQKKEQEEEILGGVV
jgi:hypothetical protein